MRSWRTGVSGGLFLPILFIAVGSIRASEPQQFASKSRLIKSVAILHDGARPRFSNDGKLLVFDRLNRDGFYDVYVEDLERHAVRSLTDGKPGIGHRNNGNAIFHPSGRFIVFTSEAEDHFGERQKSLGDPGVGLYSNFWATNLDGTRFWQLTDIPIKRRLLDREPSMASVNPLFTPDGRTFIWTQRYGEGGHNKWGRWRVMAALFEERDGRPSLAGQRVFIPPGRGSYVTEMGFLSPATMLVAGNLDGQHEYGMDQYSYNFNTGQYVNLTNTPQVWDEDSCVAPNGRIVWMSNQNSRYQFDFERADWASQPVTREYFLMDRDGRNKQQLTHFNDPDAPEYEHNRILVAACSISPDGRYLAGTIGLDHGHGAKRENVELQIILLEFARPLTGSNNKGN